MTRTAIMVAAALVAGFEIGARIHAAGGTLAPDALREPEVGVGFGSILLTPDPDSPVARGGLAVAGFGQGWDYPAGDGCCAFVHETAAPATFERAAPPERTLPSGGPAVVAAVPAPGALAGLGAGLAGLAALSALGRRR